MTEKYFDMIFIFLYKDYEKKISITYFQKLLKILALFVHDIIFIQWPFIQSIKFSIVPCD